MQVEYQPVLPTDPNTHMHTYPHTHSLTFTHIHKHSGNLPSNNPSLPILIPVKRRNKRVGGLIRSCKLIITLSDSNISAIVFGVHLLRLIKEIEKKKN